MHRNCIPYPPDTWLAGGFRIDETESVHAVSVPLDLKFGGEGLNLIPEIREIDDIDMLKSIRSKIKPAKSLDDLRAIYQKNSVFLVSFVP